MTYEDLILERKKLLIKKQENEEEIKKIDIKIEYYEWCYNHCLWNINNYQKNIKTYNKIINNYITTKTLFDISFALHKSSISDYLENRIINFEEKIKKIEKQAKNIKKIREIYIIVRNDKINIINEIDLQIEEIDETMNKEKVLIKGDKKNDRH